MEKKLCDEGQQIVVGNNGNIAVLGRHALYCNEPGCTEKYLELKRSMDAIKNGQTELKPRKSSRWPIGG